MDNPRMNLTAVPSPRTPDIHNVLIQDVEVMLAESVLEYQRAPQGVTQESAC